MIRSLATVRETNLASAPTLLVAHLHDEFDLQTTRDDWHEISLPDGRTGWIQEVAVQVIAAGPAEARRLASDEREFLEIAADLFEEVEAKADSAAQSAARFAEAFAFAKTKPKERAQLAAIDDEFQRERAKCDELLEVAARFYRPYAGILPHALNARGRVPIGLDGRASILLGRSTLNAETEEKQTSREVILEGTKTVNERSDVSFAFNHRGQLIKTPYTANDVRLEYSQTTEGGGLRGLLEHQSFKDRSVVRNDYGNFGAGGELRHRLGEHSMVTGDLRYTNRDFDDPAGASYQGLRFHSELEWGQGVSSQWRAGLGGSVQSSDAEFLDFTSFQPELRYTRHKGGGSFDARAEFERIAFAGQANLNDYTRELLELIWSRSRASRSVFVSAKQLPNNEETSYVKGGGKLQWRGTEGSGSFDTSLYGLFAAFPSGGDNQISYGEFRADHARATERRSWNASAFTRIFAGGGDVSPDHLLDLYAAYSWHFRGTGPAGLEGLHLQAGPLFGAHLLYNSDEDFPSGMETASVPESISPPGSAPERVLSI